MTVPALLASVLDAALVELRAKAIPVFTFAFFHDHESRAVSVCVDTEESSRALVISSNQYSMRYFFSAIGEGDLEQARLWQANVGRSLSLGDFSLVNLARTRLGDIPTDEAFYLEMVRAVVAVQEAVAALAVDRQRLLFACSGSDEEVALVWSLPGVA